MHETKAEELFFFICTDHFIGQYGKYRIDSRDFLSIFTPQLPGGITLRGPCYVVIAVSIHHTLPIYTLAASFSSFKTPHCTASCMCVIHEQAFAQENTTGMQTAGGLSASAAASETWIRCKQFDDR